MTPDYYNEDNLPVFTTSQVDYYGPPDIYGYDKYYVVQSRQPEYVCDYKTISGVCRNIHRYKRILRFKTILGQLLGCIGFVTQKSKDKLEDFRRTISDFDVHYTPPCMVWEFLRTKLKACGLQVFYNRIPAIAKQFNMTPVNTTITVSQWNGIMEDFVAMHEIFPRIRHKLSRKYFPNLRHTALTLMTRHGVSTSIVIPPARTIAKEKLLNNSFSEIMGLINEEYEDALDDAVY